MRRALLAAGVVAAVGLAGCGKAGNKDEVPPAAANGQPPAKPAPIPREEFRKLIMGLDADAVIKAVGKPTATSDKGNGSAYWNYDERTIDPVTGKLDSRAHVHFEDGKVAAVNF